MMKKPNRADPLVVKADGATSEEKKAFKMLQDDNPFGHGVQNMLDEYKDLKGMRIKEFVLEQPAHQSLQINIIIG
jgi:5-formaminoimidazole-4-carboxamide-1-beta-D-ribofuranosyl 5'-monophosphate synthetase